MNIGSHYWVRANKKVGRQDIGPGIAQAYTFGEKKAVIAKMRALYPHARISAHAYLFHREADLRAARAKLYPNLKEVIL